MGVKEGYKQTEVGVIPEDWKVKSIGDIANVKAGGTPSTLINTYWDGSIRWMSSGELNNKRIFDVDGRITELGLKNSSASIIPINSVLIGLAGQGKTRGTVAINYVELCTNQSVAAIFPNENSSQEFIYQYLDSKYEEIRSLSYGVGGRGGLNLKIIKGINIPLPPLTEQKAIATALSDIDGLINSLTKLIEKKKNIKQGAMQELLTGKKRLDGFSGEWKNVILKDIIINFIVPMRDKPKNLKGNIPWCRIEDFEGKYLSKSKSGQGVSKETIASMNLKVFPVGTLLVSCSAYLGRCAIVADELVTNQTFIGLLPSIKINVEYLYYVMRREEIKLNELSSGTTISYLSRSHFENYQISIPDIEEQNAIASVFLDIDLEVECLQSKLNKYKAIKQGLMQELLTGRIRLLEGA